MTTAAFIQARMGSTRLPGKVLADIAGQPALLRIVNRVRAAELVDTVVVLDGVIYGKPSDAAEARATLERLSGRVHEVVSGLAVVEEGETRTASATTRKASTTK